MVSTRPRAPLVPNATPLRRMRSRIFEPSDTREYHPQHEDKRYSCRSDAVFRLTNVIQNYAWGSHTAIAELRGEASPSAQPQAELWMGAHERGSSTLIGPDGEPITLLQYLEMDPSGVLGRRSRRAFGDRLPYLFKVLAAAQPLSLQAHPTAEQARQGFEDERRRGIPLQAAERNYKDPSHKPELICALEPFEALCGFRSTRDAVQVLESLGVAGLEPMTKRLGDYGVGAAFAWTLESEAAPNAVHNIGRACQGRDDPALAWVARLADRYPRDPGVIAALLMRYVELTPDQALYLPAGNLHAYLEGTGIEIMANSDNVLRGGLTAKHVDKVELLNVLDFDAQPPPVLEAREMTPGVWTYPTAAAEFRLSRLEVSPEHPIELSSDGPQILLCVEGALQAESMTTPLSLSQGQSALRRAADGPVRLTGQGRAFVAGLGDTSELTAPTAEEPLF